MINVKTGGFGTGKTFSLTGEITQLASEGKKVLLFVPDQFSFETERRMYMKAGAINISNIKVTSFARIAREILTLYRKAKPYADEIVKQVTMINAVNLVKNEKNGLNFYSSAAEKPGFASIMLKCAASFKNAGIGPSELCERLGEIQETEAVRERILFNKLKELSIIYSEYDKALTEKLDDKLDDVSRSAALALEHGFFKDTYCFFDNFDSFSGTQMKLLRVMAKDSKQVTICLSEGSRKSKACISNTMKKLKMTDQLKTEQFLHCRRRPEKVLVKAADPYREAQYIAAEIFRTVKEEKLRYRDILVLATSPSYQQAVSDALAMYNIPAFMDFPIPLLSRPAIRYVITLLEALDFGRDKIMALIRSGFVRVREIGKEKTRPLKSGEINRLEGMAISFDFGREQWLKPVWETIPDSKFTDKAKKLELLRELVISPLTQLKEALEKAIDGTEFTAVLVDYLTKVQDLRSTFIARSKSGTGEGTDYLKLSRKSKEEYGKLWERLIQIFDSMAYILKGKKVSIKEYTEILKDVMSNMTLAKPPAVLDAVTVGDTERTRRGETKVLFICGAWEGAFPKKSGDTANFTSLEQETLSDWGVELEENNTLRRSKETYYAERSMALPEQRLILFFPEKDFAGQEQSLSSLVSDCDDIEEWNRIDAGKLPPEFYATSLEAVKELASYAYGQLPDVYRLISKAVPENIEFYKKLEKLGENNVDMKILPETAEKLYGIRYSPTQLNIAFSCLFRHFCTYGLKLREREDNDILDAAQTGNITHRILKDLLSQSTLPNDEQSLDLFLEEETEKELRLFQEKGFHDIYKNKAALERLKLRIKKVAQNILQELNSTGFSPVGLEQRLEYKIYPDGDISMPPKMVVYGISDRIDEKQEGGVTYVRICDYKTGKIDLDMESVKNGMDLQMFLYLFACCDFGGDVGGEVGNKKPGAVEYLLCGHEPAYRGFASDYSQNAGRLNWLESHKPVLLWDKSVGEGIAGYYDNLASSITGGKSRKKLISLSGEFTEEDFLRLKTDIDNMLLEKQRKIDSGDVSPVPLILDEKSSPCRYCPFGNMCGNKNGEKRVKVLAD